MIAITALLLLLLFAAAAMAGNGWSNVLSEARNELVFADRHRAYGAYMIRRAHGRTMAAALLCMMGFVAALVFVPRMLFAGAEVPPPPLPAAREVTLVAIMPPTTAQADARPPAPRPKPRPTMSASSAGALVAIDTTLVADIDTATTATGTATTEGDGDPGPADAGPDGTGTGDDHGEPGAGERIVDVWQLDVMPEYPGGMEALYADLRRIVRYPEDDRQHGRQGRVYITFVVTETGAIDQVQLARGVSRTLDAEAVRAVGLLKKKWAPGEYQGRPVRVRFNLPIAFQIPRS